MKASHLPDDEIRLDVDKIVEIISSDLFVMGKIYLCVNSMAGKYRLRNSSRLSFNYH
jgi:hypothetical protein